MKWEIQVSPISIVKFKNKKNKTSTLLVEES